MRYYILLITTSFSLTLIEASLSDFQFSEEEITTEIGSEKVDNDNNRVSDLLHFALHAAIITIAIHKWGSLYLHLSNRIRKSRINNRSTREVLNDLVNSNNLLGHLSDFRPSDKEQIRHDFKATLRSLVYVANSSLVVCLPFFMMQFLAVLILPYEIYRGIRNEYLLEFATRGRADALALFRSVIYGTKNRSKNILNKYFTSSEINELGSLTNALMQLRNDQGPNKLMIRGIGQKIGELMKVGRMRSIEQGAARWESYQKFYIELFHGIANMFRYRLANSARQTIPLLDEH